MKKNFLFFLIILPIYLLISLYFLDKDYFICPIEYKRNIIIRSDNRGNGFFGAERKGKRIHQGLDLFAEIGTPVSASRSGRVTAAKQNNSLGKFVIIKHPANLITVYGHLSEIFVKKNQFVRQGEIIGSVGKTGNASFRDIQPHLHFEVRRKGVPQDPLSYLE